MKTFLNSVYTISQLFNHVFSSDSNQNSLRVLIFESLNTSLIDYKDFINISGELYFPEHSRIECDIYVYCQKVSYNWLEVVMSSNIVNRFVDN